MKYDGYVTPEDDLVVTDNHGEILTEKVSDVFKLLYQMKKQDVSIEDLLLALDMSATIEKQGGEIDNNYLHKDNAKILMEKDFAKNVMRVAIVNKATSEVWLGEEF